MPVIKVKDNLGLIEKAILALTKSEVVIGIPEGGERQDGGPSNSIQSGSDINFAS